MEDICSRKMFSFFLRKGLFIRKAKLKREEVRPAIS